MKSINIKIKTSNMPGVTFKTLEIFNSYKADILLLEVLSEVIYVKFSLQDPIKKHEMYSEIKEKTFTKYMEEIPYFPSEIKSKQLKDLFSKFEEAIVITDKNYEIQFENDSFHMINKSSNPNLKKIFKALPNLDESYIRNSNEFFEVTLPSNESANTTITSYASNIFDEVLFIWVIYFADDFQKKFIKPNYQTMNKLDDIIYSSGQMEQLIEVAKTISKTNVTILIRGESGTGKELFSRGIHEYSKRSEFPFITVNCSAIPDALLESELFGYEGGSFTGSLKDGKKGLFEQANKGTIFLDEIGDLPYHLQSKLLRAIDTKKIRRIGGDREIELDVRIFAATHQSLEEFIDQGLFRLDLFYRLNVYSIQIPPLRVRREDIKYLSLHFMKKFNNLFGKKSEFSKAAMQKLMDHNWPGNVRELENTIERTVFLSREIVISATNVKLDYSKHKNNNESFDMENKNYNTLFHEFESMLFNHSSFLNKTTRQIATELGISHTSVANKIKKYR